MVSHFVTPLVAVLILIQAIAVNAKDNFNPEPIIFRAEPGNKDVEDGDSFWLGIHKIRLYGIDALESRQTCTLAGKIDECAERARLVLKDFVEDPNFECRVHRKKGKPWIRYNRYVATCFVGSKNVNEEMVKMGMALADHTSFGDDYREIEKDAHKRKVGIHKSTYTKPHEFRQGLRNQQKNCVCD